MKSIFKEMSSKGGHENPTMITYEDYSKGSFIVLSASKLTKALASLRAFDTSGILSVQNMYFTILEKNYQ